ncbi:coiled-coil domain-containing protein 96-like [Bacillus rossius redtenbacheri]|uniref:coiled-coil domain-containing protein 96-like n=1 Tax=Bacillus rossius redtenbacheri TaxID=93214 RepID=UPI002FDEC7D4
MAEENSDVPSDKEIEELENESLLEDTANDSDKSDETSESNVAVTDAQERDIHDRLSTIPEENDSLASKIDIVEFKETREIVELRERLFTLGNAVEIGGMPADGEAASDGAGRRESVSEEEAADRAAQAERYQNLVMELTVARHRNLLLQKKVVEHFKKRKMEIVSQTEEDDFVDPDVKYQRQLQEFKELKDKLSEQEQIRENEIAELEEQSLELNESSQASLNELVAYVNQALEKLQHGKADKAFQNEVVERLTRRLVGRLGELGRLQLEHARLRDGVAAREERKRGLEECCGGPQLADYARLRTENQGLVARVEDRDEELARLRARAMRAVHDLAHVRQKAWAAERAVGDATGRLRDVEEQLVQMREEVSAAKKRRDHHRAETERLRRAAGLVVEPALLRDYEQSLEEAARLSAELQNVRNSHHDDRRRLAELRSMLRLARLPDRSGSVECLQISIPCRAAPGGGRKC